MLEKNEKQGDIVHLFFHLTTFTFKRYNNYNQTLKVSEKNMIDFCICSHKSTLYSTTLFKVYVYPIGIDVRC